MSKPVEKLMVVIKLEYATIRKVVGSLQEAYIYMNGLGREVKGYQILPVEE